MRTATHARYQRPCGSCGATPTRAYKDGPACVQHTPAALAGREENHPDPTLTLTALRADGGAHPNQARVEAHR